MSILGRARQIESRLARSIDRAAQRLAGTTAAEPLEVMHAIVDTIDDHLVPAGRDTHVFPFNRIDVFILAPSAQERARFEAVFDSVQPLDQRIAERLRAARCDSSSLDVRTQFVDRAGDDWANPLFHVAFERIPSHTRSLPGPEIPRQHILVTVLHGSAHQPTYSFAVERFNLGRCAEVRDQRSRLIRINHVAFDDLRSEPNQSVSRQHAHIEFSSESQSYRVCDDRSGHGTHVVRNGRTLPVPPGPRGIKLHAGDEILLGEARLRVDLIADAIPY
jgi:hypothetical protein